jgi:hypothetical protein
LPMRLSCSHMTLFRHSFFRGLASFVRLAACLLSLMSLLTFPAPKPHQFLDHFRTPEIFREVEGHSFLDRSKSNVSEEIATSYREPGKIPVLDSSERTNSVSEDDSNTIVPLARLLSRLKLGPSSPAPTDPLL